MAVRVDHCCRRCSAAEFYYVVQTTVVRYFFESEMIEEGKKLLEARKPSFTHDAPKQS